MDKRKRIYPRNYIILSLDVKSLFTNVLIQGALACLEKRVCKFHCSTIEIEEILNLVYLCDSQTAFDFIVFFVPKLRVWEWESHFLIYFVIFKFTTLNKNTSVRVTFLVGLDTWMTVLFVFLRILTFLVFCPRFLIDRCI